MLCRSTKELALFIIDQRKKLGLTQTEVAQRVGLKQKTISAFENNPENSKVSTLFLIISALNLDLKLLDKDVRDQAWQHEW